jgi:hypothetical protein
VDLVDEQDIALFQTRQQTGQLPGFFDHRPARVLYVHAHRVRDDVRERRFPEPGRAAEEDVLEDVSAFFGRFHEQLETLTDLRLAGELAEHRRPQRDFKSGIRLRRFHLAR